MKHIILDLDETIINISDKPSKNDHFNFKIGAHMYYGQKRPGLDDFLTGIFALFESVNIWTAATHDYADNVIRCIMTPTQRAQLKFMFSREKLQVAKNGSYSKPLRKLFITKEAIALGMNRTNTIMIDDREEMFKNNKGNGIVIPPWTRGSNDQYLYDLLVILQDICAMNACVSSAKKPLFLKDFV